MYKLSYWSESNLSAHIVSYQVAPTIAVRTCFSRSLLTLYTTVILLYAFYIVSCTLSNKHFRVIFSQCLAGVYTAEPTHHPHVFNPLYWKILYAWYMGTRIACSSNQGTVTELSKCWNNWFEYSTCNLISSLSYHSTVSTMGTVGFRDTPSSITVTS